MTWCHHFDLADLALLLLLAAAPPLTGTAASPLTISTLIFFKLLPLEYLSRDLGSGVTVRPLDQLNRLSLFFKVQDAHIEIGQGKFQERT